MRRQHESHTGDGPMPGLAILAANNEFKDPKIGLSTPKTFEWSEVGGFSATLWVEQALLTGHEDATSFEKRDVTIVY
jgi:hypothetical protein